MKIHVREEKSEFVDGIKKEEIKTIPENAQKRNKKTIPNNSKTSSENSSLKKTRFDKKHFLPLLLTIVIIIITVIIVALSKSQIIDESYFISDENKDVITLEVSGTDAVTTNLVRTHIVYTYEGDRITSLKTYYEYENNELAKQALENTKAINQNAESVDLNDKYIIVTSKSDQYNNLSSSDIKQQAEAIRNFQESQKKSQKKE